MAPHLKFHKLLLHDGDALAVVIDVCPQLFDFVGQGSHVADQGTVQVSRGAEILQHEAVVVLSSDARLGVFDTFFKNNQTSSNVSDVFILLNDAVAFLCLRDTVSFVLARVRTPAIKLKDACVARNGVVRAFPTKNLPSESQPFETLVCLSTC